jgi:glycyl-tRNA synthetase beta chain
MQHELIFEIGTEEIPAGYLNPAIDNLARLLTDRLNELGLTHGAVRTAVTPRRLTVCIPELAAAQADRREEILGPPKAAAFDAAGKPTKAAEGFARSKGATLDDIRIAVTPKGEYLQVVVERKGQKTIDLLPEVLTDSIGRLPFPKSMRWGAGRASFARPIRWLLASYGDAVVPCRVNDTDSGRTTRGHRFMAPAPLTVTGFTQYLDSLRQAHVVADPAERREAVRREVDAAAKVTGGEVLPDEELLDTVTNLVEEPHAVCGSFDEKFLAVPREVLITSMREHQKYFAIADSEGRLLPNFIAVNNTATRDRELAVNGHQRVLRARLEDALFFFKEDQQQKLAERTNQLSGIVFQAGLGTMLEKSARVESLTGELTGILRLPAGQENIARRAAQLAKADLLTAMVGEFPTLQGVMGRAYARLDGEPEEVAMAIAEHYLPVRAGSEGPETLPGALVGLADRIDTIAGCFGIGKQPTGTTDPYGLRRQALGLLAIIERHQLSLSLRDLTVLALDLYGDKVTVDREAAREAVLDFLKGRYVNDLTAKGLPGAAVEAVTSVDFDDAVDCTLRIKALAAVQNQETFTILAGSFKRVRNIIKDNDDDSVNRELLIDPSEMQLTDTLAMSAAEAEPHLANHDYQAAMTAILKMKEPVDRFFDQVMVMAEDEALRRNRLNLLTGVSRLFLKIGDFSKMS